MGWLSRLAALKLWARRLRLEVVAVYFAARDPRTPRALRWLALLVAAYALSPIDLIPDFIPVLGWLDDLILVPLGLWVIMRWLPPEVLQASRRKAEALWRKPRSLMAAAFIVLLWALAALIAGVALWRWLAR